MRHDIHPDGSRGAPAGHVTRRTFAGLTAGLAAGVAGYALAARPVAASAVTTPGDGLVTADFEVTAGDGASLPGYLARPEGPGPFPMVHVVHEIFGVHDYIRDVCRRLAHEGYLAATANLYARAGDTSTLSSYEDIFPIVATATPSQVNADLDAIGAFLAAEAGGDAARTGVTGFCWGGAATWLYAAHNPALRAGVAWYGRLAAPAERDGRPWPVDVANDLRVPVLGLYGGRDTLIPQADVDRMRAALAAAPDAPETEIIVYGDAGHGFHADYRQGYDAAAAADGWARLLAWFRTHGLGQARAPRKSP